MPAGPAHTVHTVKNHSYILCPLLPTFKRKNVESQTHLFLELHAESNCILIYQNSTLTQWNHTHLLPCLIPDHYWYWTIYKHIYHICFDVLGVFRLIFQIMYQTHLIIFEIFSNVFLKTQWPSDPCHLTSNSENDYHWPTAFSDSQCSFALACSRGAAKAEHDMGMDRSSLSLLNEWDAICQYVLWYIIYLYLSIIYIYIYIIIWYTVYIYHVISISWSRYMWLPVWNLELREWTMPRPSQALSANPRQSKIQIPKPLD